jgi:hypothetical protein
MSNKNAQQNLVQNGEFTAKGQSWNLQSVGCALFENDECAVQAPDSVYQDVDIKEEGEYRFSAKLKSLPGAACSASVLLHPSGQIFSLDVGGGTAWEALHANITVPAGTTKATIKLEANDGVSIKFGSYFDDVRFEKR